MRNELAMVCRHTSRLWQLAFLAVLFIPLGLIFSRGGADFACSATGLLFLYNSLRTRQWGWTRDPLLRAGLLAWAWLVLGASPLAVNPPESFSAALPWGRFILFYAALRHWVLAREAAFKILALWLTLVFCGILFDTLWQYAFSKSLGGHLRIEQGRLTGPFDNVKVGIYLARLMVPAAGLWLFFACRSSSRRWVYLALLLIALINITILLSGERTAFMSSFAALFMVAVYFIWRMRKIRWKLFALLFLWLALLGSIFLSQNWVQKRSQDLNNHITHFSESPYGQLFEAGFLLGLDNPLTGTGLRGFRELCPSLIERGKIKECNLHPHNPYLEWFAEAGLPGLCLLMVVIVAMLQHVRRTWGDAKDLAILPPAFALASIFGSYFPFMATQSSFSNWPAILLWYSTGIALAALNLAKPENNGMNENAAQARLSA